MFAFLAGAAAQSFPLPPAPGAAQGAADVEPVRASLAFDVGSIVPGSSFSATLTLEHAEGWHTYGPESADTGLPTAIEWTLPEGITAGSIDWPKSERFSDRGVDSFGYSGAVSFRVPMRASARLPEGSARIEAKVTWLACKEACVPGKAEFAFVIPVAKAAPLSFGALLAAVAGAFLGGLILNLMPCVLPVLSLKLHGFIAREGSSRKVSFAYGLAYGLGILVSFWITAAVLLAFKSGGTLVGWGFQFQEPRFVAVLALCFFAFGLNMLGVFEIGGGAAAFAERGAKRTGLARSFVSGVFTMVAATPCTAPFMGAAIGFALSADAFSAFAVFTALGLGLGFPIVAMSAFPTLARRLPKAGRWMESLKQLLAFGLFATVIWLLSVLERVSDPGALPPTLAALLGTGVAAWIYGRWSAYDRSTAVRRIAAAGGLLVFALSLALALYFAEGDAAVEDLGRRARSVAPELVPSADSESLWEAFDPDLVAELRASGTPVFVDFSADWCLTCKANELTVLGAREIVDAFRARGVRAFKADWTRSDPVVTKALAAFGRSSVPLYVLYLPGEPEPRILPEILTANIVLDALADLEPSP